MGKKKLQEFSKLGKTYNPNETHTKNMRNSEMSHHFGRVSTVMVSTVFEGGNEGEMSPIMDFDDNDMSDGGGLAADEEELMMGGGVKGAVKAEETIKTQIIAGAQDVKLNDLDLQSLDFLNQHIWPTLKEIYIKKNMIQNIDILNRYTSLKVIDASNNFIQEVNLSLPKLTHLDLSFNKITVYPRLTDCTKLYSLNLNNNQLIGIEELNANDTPNLINLFLSSNNIEFDDKEQLAAFIKQLRSFPKLGQLNIEDNPFWEPQIIERNYPNIILEEKFMDGLQLELFNGLDMGQLRKIVQAKIAEWNKNEETIGPSPSVLEEMKKTEKSERKESKKKKPVNEKEKDKTSAPPPSLDQLIQYLEDANCHPEESLESLAKLASSCDEVVLKVDQLEQYFAPGRSEQEMAEMIVTFMQNSLLLIDNYFDMQNIMMTILAKLSVIKFSNFGLNCFNTLKDLMMSGRELQNQVREILKVEVIEKMRQNDPYKIPVTLLQGLHQLIEETEESEMLQSMYDVNFPNWLRKYCTKLDECKRQKMVLGNDEHFDSIISLLSVSVQDNEVNVELVKEKELLPFITQIIKQSTLENDRYIPILKLIATLSNADYEIADYFVKSLVQNILLTQIKKSMKIYKKYNSLFDDNSKDTIEQQRHKYQTLSAEITTLGGLLQASPENKAPILKDPILKDLLTLMSHDLTDPILLTAVCTFALDLFECDELKNDEYFMAPFHAKISDMKHLIPYLGFDKYYELLEMAKKYHGAVQSAQKPDGKDEDIKQPIQQDEQENSVDDDEEEDRKLDGIKSSLNHLDDPIVSELFISIINLMKFFCLEAENYDSNQNILFDAVSQSLNENMREQALFNCLAVSDDNVKLAVVRCLFVVPLDELESDEISQITGIMSQCNNIGAGKTELVLSTVYWICYKLSVGDPEELESSKIFQSKFGENTMNEALTILQKNLIRINDQEEEDQEKYALSLSILNFVKASSHAPIMQKYMRQKSDIFKQILISEELFSSDRVNRIPIDIENSIMGQEMTTMIETISGNETIQPYCDVSLRVLMRMADILMSRHEFKYYNIEVRDDVVQALEEFQENLYSKKLSQELDYWVDVPARFFDDWLDYESRKELNNQHQFFTQSNGVALLKMFLTQKFPINEEYLKKLYDPVFEEFKGESEKPLGIEISEKKSFFEHKFRAKYMLDEYSVRRNFFQKYQATQDKKAPDSQPQDNADPDEEEKKEDKNTTGTEQYKFSQLMQFEEVGNDYGSTLMNSAAGQSKSDIEFKLLEKLKDEQQKIKNDPNGGQLSLKEKRGDGFLNARIRSLTIAAFLRCLYAAVEYAPSYQLRQNAIQNIRDPIMFRGITQLCDATDWDENANIGSKYLRVMRSVIKMPLDKDRQKTDMLVHYELIAIVIQKCLAKIVGKMKKDIELNDGDKVSIYEISLTFFTVLQQANNFLFSDFNIMANHLMNEAKIAIKAENKLNKRRGGPIKKLPPVSELLKESEVGPWKPKCQYEEFDYKGAQKTPENYHVSLVTLRAKRTIQEKIVEFMVLKLFSKQSIFSLIDILFKDMKDDYKIFEPDEEEEDEEEEEEEKKSEQALSGEGVEEDVDPTKYFVDIEEYMGIKGTLTIERIKDIVGEIMSSCAGKMKYEILEIIMKGVIFEKKKLRESFMQEILNSAENATFKNSLEIYMNQNEMHCRKYFGEKGEVFEHPIYERIIEFAQVDVNYKYVQRENEFHKVENNLKPDTNFYNRIMVITSEGIQFLKNLPQVFRCHNCPKVKFCPRGPMQDFCIDFLDLETVVNFPQLPQKIVIKFLEDLSNPDGSFGGQDYYQVTLNIPSYTKSAKIFQNLKQIMEKAKADKQIIAQSRPQGQLLVSVNSKKHEPDLTYLDRLVTFYLHYLIQEINKEVSRTSVNNLQLIYATLKQTTLLSKKFWDENIISKPAKDFTPTKKCKSLPSSFDPEEDNVIPNCVIICIIGGYLILLKETWNNWEFYYDMITFKNYCHTFKRELLDQEKPPAEPLTEKDPVQDNEIMCRSYSCPMFQVVTMIPVDKIDNLDVHKGPNPTVCVVSHDAKHNTEILFTGDMERQKFIDYLIQASEGGGEEEGGSEKGGEEGEEDEDSSDQGGCDESEDEEVKAIIYD